MASDNHLAIFLDCQIKLQKNEARSTPVIMLSELLNQPTKSCMMRGLT